MIPPAPSVEGRDRYRALAGSETIGSILRRKGSSVHSVPPDSTVFAAIQRMADARIGALIVQHGDKIVGIVSERDYARKVILQGRSSRITLVREIMTSDLITVTPMHTVRDCMQIMTVNRVRHLPVLDAAGGLLGIVSIGDLVSSLLETQAHTIDQLSSYIAQDYPK